MIASKPNSRASARLTTPNSRNVGSANSHNDSRKNPSAKGEKKKKKKKAIIEDLKLVTELLAHAENNSLDLFRSAIESEFNQKKYDFTQTAGECIVIAAARGNIELLNYLIELIHNRIHYDYTKALYRAALFGQYDSVYALIKLNIPINTKLPFNELTALHAAAKNGNIEIMNLLLSAGAKIDETNHPLHNEQYNGWAAIHYAADMGHLSVLQSLIQHGAVIDLPNAAGDTATAIAAERGNWEAVKCLINNNANIHARRRGLNIVEWAIYLASIEAVQWLISYGATVDFNLFTTWFKENQTLRQVIYKEFSESVYNEIDLAVYRGSLAVKERQEKFKILSEIQWEVAAVFDPYSFDPLPPPTIKSFPTHIIHLINNYDL
jgi:ankyrin repeat protein